MQQQTWCATVTVLALCLAVIGWKFYSKLTFCLGICHTRRWAKLAESAADKPVPLRSLCARNFFRVRPAFIEITGVPQFIFTESKFFVIRVASTMSFCCGLPLLSVLVLICSVRAFPNGAPCNIEDSLKPSVDAHGPNKNSADKAPYILKLLQDGAEVSCVKTNENYTCTWFSQLFKCFFHIFPIF